MMLLLLPVPGSVQGAVKRRRTTRQDLGGTAQLELEASVQCRKCLPAGKSPPNKEHSTEAFTAVAQLEVLWASGPCIDHGQWLFPPSYPPKSAFSPTAAALPCFVPSNPANGSLDALAVSQTWIEKRQAPLNASGKHSPMVIHARTPRFSAASSALELKRKAEPSDEVLRFCAARNEAIDEAELP
ncbi:hypothetical protein GE21DRAFT_1343959 [Neurospora crassa]|nr:hypothetical protein GE21DRAFT_1343959 [Neurospora crassa]